MNLLTALIPFPEPCRNKACEERHVAHSTSDGRGLHTQTLYVSVGEPVTFEKQLTINVLFQMCLIYNQPIAGKGQISLARIICKVPSDSNAMGYYNSYKKSVENGLSAHLPQDLGSVILSYLGADTRFHQLIMSEFLAQHIRHGHHKRSDLTTADVHAFFLLASSGTQANKSLGKWHNPENAQSAEVSWKLIWPAALD